MNTDTDWSIKLLRVWDVLWFQCCLQLLTGLEMARNRY